MSDKFREANQFNLLKIKYNLGNHDTTRDEFMTNVFKDTYASLSHHKILLLYNSLALDENIEVFRQSLIKKMIFPKKKV